MSDIKCYYIEVPCAEVDICLLEDDGRFELLTFDSGIPEMWIEWLSEQGLEPIRFRSYKDDESLRRWFCIATDGTPTSIATSNVLFDHTKHMVRATQTVVQVFEGD